LAHPYFLLGGLFILGLSLIAVNGVVGFKAEGTPGAWSGEWLLAQGEKLGYILAVSGVIGVVSRMLWLTGVLAKALSDVMLGDAVLDIRSDLPQLWRRLTQRIYLHGFKARTPQDEAFLENVHRAMDRSIAQRHDSYARNMDAHYRIEEVEGEPNKLKVSRTVTYDLHPFHPDGTITVKTWSKAASGVDVADYHLEETAYTVDGVSALDRRKSKREGDRITYWIELSGKAKYVIQREATSYILLDKDPFMVFSAPYVIDHLTFRATSEVSGLATFFEEVGVEGAFEDMLARIIHGAP